MLIPCCVTAHIPLPFPHFPPSQDPFFEQNLDHNEDAINRLFKKFVPPGYDVYVFGVQEAVSDSVFDAFAK